MASPHNIKLTLRVSPEEHDALKVAAAQRKTALQSVLYSLVMGWLDGSDVPAQEIQTKYSKPTQHWHELLEEILTHGTDRQRLGIQSNLEAFAAMLHKHH